MFEKGEYVVRGRNGVCRVTDVTTLNFGEVDKKRRYYVLTPVYQQTSKIYVPVDTQDGSLRRILTKDEIMRLIDSIPEIGTIEIGNEKMCEELYRNSMQEPGCEGYVKVLKTLYLRRQKRQESGRKESAVDGKYQRMAEESLYGEIAVALGISREEVEDFITEQIEGRHCVPG